MNVEVVDHVEPHGGIADRFFNGELQSLCKRHHDGLKQGIERAPVSPCDANGMPLDPSHPWNG